MRLSHRIALFAVLLCVSASARAQVTTTVNFNNGTPEIGVAPGFYAGQGVAVLNATWSDFLGGRSGSTPLPDGAEYPNDSNYWLFGCCSIKSTSSGNYVPPTDPIIALFTQAMQSVSIRGLDVSFLGLRLEAFDFNGLLVGTATAGGPNSGGVGQTVTVNGSDIWRVEFSQDVSGTPGSDGIAFDDLTFTTQESATPEPATVLLLAPALCAIAVGARRRKGISHRKDVHR
ncbi:MAG: hypothetical protein V4550_05950 [Gemmatimonadota bacterium]